MQCLFFIFNNSFIMVEWFEETFVGFYENNYGFPRKESFPPLPLTGKEYSITKLFETIALFIAQTGISLFFLLLLIQINVLIEDLGLEQVRNTKVSGMTISERRRLNVACHLLLDTDIVVLDQPTRGMDIFDTFFLVEYLRQWANGGTGNALGKFCLAILFSKRFLILET